MKTAKFWNQHRADTAKLLQGNGSRKDFAKKYGSLPKAIHKLRRKDSTGAE